MLVKDEVKKLVVGKVELSKDMAEMMNLQISMKNSQKREIAVAYVALKTRAWVKGTTLKQWMTQSTARIINKSENTILMGNFNCKKFDWQNLSTEGSEESWSSKLLSMVIDNVMTVDRKRQTIPR